jgi:hypothetical protein
MPSLMLPPIKDGLFRVLGNSPFQLAAFKSQETRKQENIYVGNSVSGRRKILFAPFLS